MYILTHLDTLYIYSVVHCGPSLRGNVILNGFWLIEGFYIIYSGFVNIWCVTLDTLTSLYSSFCVCKTGNLIVSPPRFIAIIKWIHICEVPRTVIVRIIKVLFISSEMRLFALQVINIIFIMKTPISIYVLWENLMEENLDDSMDRVLIWVQYLIGIDLPQNHITYSIHSWIHTFT